jgi:hypothetical protein
MQFGVKPLALKCSRESNKIESGKKSEIYCPRPLRLSGKIINAEKRKIKKFK